MVVRNRGAPIAGGPRLSKFCLPRRHRVRPAHPMFALRCSVRGCERSLEHRRDGLTCAAGHHFDRAKWGYWNLTQPQDRRSQNPGDAESAVLARHRWLERGYGSGLVDAIRPWLTGVVSGDGAASTRTLDLGCGEGWFGAALFPDDGEAYCGIDLSKRAVRIAARRWPEATWVLANADRELPVGDRSVDRVVSLFGRRPVTEIRRVISPAGVCLVAIPAEDDLIELRERVHKSGHRRSRWEAVVEEMRGGGLECVQRSTWRERVTLEPDAITDALAMTYRAARHAEQARARELTATDVTLAAELLLFRPKPPAGWTAATAALPFTPDPSPGEPPRHRLNDGQKGEEATRRDQQEAADPPPTADGVEGTGG